MIRSALLIVWPLVLYFFINLPSATACSSKKKLEEIPGENYCRTETCDQEAQRILDALDHDVDPCDNFYKFACADSLRNIPVSQDTLPNNNDNVIAIKVLKELRELLKESSLPEEEKYITIAKQLYRACTDEAARENQGLEVLSSFLKTELGGWPVVEGDNWIETDFDWLKTIYKLQGAGHPHFLIQLKVERDLGNNTRNVLTLDHASYRHNLSSYKEYYYHLQFVEDLAIMLGADPVRAKLEMKYAFDFEMSLRAFAMPENMRSNATTTYNPMTIATLTQRYPSIPWKEFFQRMLPKSIVVDDNEIIVVRDPMYISKLEKLMSQTPKRIQANYMMYQVVLDSVFFLNHKIGNRYEKYMAEAYGYFAYVSGWGPCTLTTYNLMPMSVSALYLQKHSNANTRHSVNGIVNDMKRKFLAMMENVDWMDNSTRRHAEDKVDAMTSLVGYPDVLFNSDHKLAEIYKNCAIVEEDALSYYDAYLNAARCKREAMLNNLRTPGNQSYALMFARIADVNTYTIHSENKIVLSMAYLQGIVFNNDRPKYLNYANIGRTIAHEMHRNFDLEGRQYDKNGNLFDWWTAAAEKKYMSKIQCITDQYKKYMTPEIQLKLDGVKAESENFADIGDLKLAYLTYKNWVARYGPEPRLPDLPYNPNQLFWISAANAECAADNDKLLKDRELYRAHSSAEFRVLGAFSNTPEFAEDFNCPMGSNMNPKEKCTIW